MTTIAVPGPPEHLTDATGSVGAGAGLGVAVGLGVGEGLGFADGVGVGSGCWVGDADGLGAGVTLAVGAAAPQATAISPANKRVVQRFNPMMTA